jgi:uncharacterized protein YbaP (TraB family)
MQRLLAGFCLLFLLLPAALAAEAPGKGRLWRIERAGLADSYLFGTMHSSDPQVLALPASVLRALQKSRAVVGELVIKQVNAASVLARAMLPADRSLADAVPADLYAGTLQALQAYGIPAGVADRLDLWFVVMLLSDDPAEVARQRAGAQVLDEWLQATAERQGKAVLGLETMDEQIAVFAGWPRDMLVSMLRGTLAYPALVRRSQAALLALWSDGDLPSMDLLFRVSTLPMPPEQRRILTETLVLNRNHLMAARLQPILAEGGAFVAVGALHLAGEEGLINLLRDMDWTVSRAD